MDLSKKIGFAEEIIRYDALVYIHPDMATSPQVIGNPYYIQNIRLTNKIMYEHQKPVFFFPLSEYFSHYISKKITKNWIKIPSKYYMLSKLDSKDLQDHVDFIAETIGKLPEEISIAAGGMALSVCVTDFMTCWCNYLHGPYSSLAIQKPIERKLREGTIIPDLTDVSSLLL